MRLALRFTLLAAGLALAVIASAQSGQSAAPQASMQKASDWLDRAVISTDGQRLGSVQDFAIDQNTGTITFVVISVGSFLIDHNLIAVHPDALAPAPGDTDDLLLLADDASLRQANRFADDNWPMQADVVRSDAVAIASLDAQPAPVEPGNDDEDASESGTASITDGLRTAFLSAGERTIQTRLETPPPAPAKVKPNVRADRSPKTKFDRLDSDGDDALNRAEFALEIAPNDSYSELDRNGNGLIDRDEFEAIQERDQARD